jgi:hypothetical protein
MDRTIIDEIRKALAMYISKTNDLAEIFIISLLLYGLSRFSTPHVELGTEQRISIEDDVRWLLEEAKNCSDDKCVEAVVRETIKKLKNIKHQ